MCFILKQGLNYYCRCSMRKYRSLLNSSSILALFSASIFGFGAFGAQAQELQLPEAFDETAEQSAVNSLELEDLNDDFEFSNDGFDFEKTPEELREEARKQAFDAAVDGLMPLRPEEIRTLLERLDRTQKSVATPVYPSPKPEVVVQELTLDPGSPPAVIKLAYGHVTTVTFMDSTGAPWPIKDISWAGDFEVIESDTDPERFQHVMKLSPQSEFAHGNMSISMLALKTPIIVTLETNRDIVHYRFDAVVPDYGPLAQAPLIETGLSTTAGNRVLSSALEGVFPSGAQRLDVEGVDGRTSAYSYGGKTYVRTPLTLLSPGWDSSTSSADGTTVYQIDDTPVLLLSRQGRMVRARLSDREDILDEQ